MALGPMIKVTWADLGGTWHGWAQQRISAVPTSVQEISLIAQAQGQGPCSVGDWVIGRDGFIFGESNDNFIANYTIEIYDPNA